MPLQHIHSSRQAAAQGCCHYKHQCSSRCSPLLSPDDARIPPHVPASAAEYNAAALSSPQVVSTWWYTQWRRHHVVQFRCMLGHPQCNAVVSTWLPQETPCSVCSCRTVQLITSQIGGRCWRDAGGSGGHTVVPHWTPSCTGMPSRMQPGAASLAGSDAAASATAKLNIGADDRTHL